MAKITLDDWAMLNSSILNSTLNELPAKTKWVFIICCLMANETGKFKSSIEGIARQSNVPLDDVVIALNQLQQPEPTSTSKEYDGRRLVSVSQNIWQVVNKDRYVKMATEELITKRTGFNDWVMLNRHLMNSSLNDLPVVSRWVFLACCLMSDEDGNYVSTIGGMSRQSNTTLEEATEAVRQLQAKDSESTSQEFGGARLVNHKTNFWQVVNKKKYLTDALSTIRAVRAQERVQGFRERKQLNPLVEEYLAACAGNCNEPNEEETPCNAMKRDVTRCNAASRDVTPPPAIDQIIDHAPAAAHTHDIDSPICSIPEVLDPDPVLDPSDLALIPELGLRSKCHLKSQSNNDLTLLCQIGDANSTGGAAVSELEQLFEFWKQVLNHPRSKIEGKMHRKRREKMQAALEEYGLARCKLAIIGCASSPHNMGMNDRHTKYDSLELIFRDGEKMEYFEAMGETAETFIDNETGLLQVKIRESKAPKSQPRTLQSETERLMPYIQEPNPFLDRLFGNKTASTTCKYPDAQFPTFDAQSGKEIKR